MDPHAIAVGHADASNRQAGPIVKWAGGKGRLLAQLRSLLPAGIEGMRHIEPFAGGLALFFDRNPERALVSDVNPGLIGMYMAVRDELPLVLEHLQRLALGHSPERYYAMRARYNTASLEKAERAAVFIYLNKTCFNGLHRVNRRGEFNVPVGRYAHPKIVDRGALLAARSRLSRAELRCGSFELVCQLAEPGDFVYLDPPYAPVSRTANFTAYARGGFGADRQRRLREVFGELDRRGCAVMLSNSDSAEVRGLYGGYPVAVVHAPRSINSHGARRKRVAELVIRNYEDR